MIVQNEFGYVRSESCPHSVDGPLPRWFQAGQTVPAPAIDVTDLIRKWASIQSFIP
jgi:hypothetical protein